ncbi:MULTISPECIES: phage holin family protein [Peribacillus]|uniref:phage holin family protein n=1 Tax=Peribacillus TaxID=2675229 RepID=UPI001F4D3FB8|nr:MULTISPECIES: phage holin family protein [unclassified Peribacillus]MCK1985156.1 phage holin family protein [Peribacillus sp. Aquil_B1]MCK2007194.1 phage holin family protein [Peribacillus sp. Aquil_B8]
MFKLTLFSSMVGIPLTFLFGAWTPLLGVLLVMIVLDILTGVAKGFYDKALRSRNMSQGMMRKAGIIVVLIIANMLDIVMFAGMPVAKTAVISFYIGMEGLSILENLGLMGVPLPSFIKKYLLVLKEKADTIEVKQVEQIIVKQGEDGVQMETTTIEEITETKTIEKEPTK